MAGCHHDDHVRSCQEVFSGQPWRCIDVIRGLRLIGHLPTDAYTNREDYIPPIPCEKLPAQEDELEDQSRTKARRKALTERKAFCISKLKRAGLLAKTITLANIIMLTPCQTLHRSLHAKVLHLQHHQQVAPQLLHGSTAISYNAEEESTKKRSARTFLVG